MQQQQHQQAVAAAQQKHAAASLRHAMSTNPAMATAENATRLRQLDVSEGGTRKKRATSSLAVKGGFPILDLTTLSFFSLFQNIN